jgi:hypothetical protein
VGVARILGFESCERRIPLLSISNPWSSTLMD